LNQNNLIKEAFIENNNYLNKHKKDGNINASSLIEFNENENEIDNKVKALESSDKELNELIKKKFIQNGEMFGKLSDQVSKIDEMINNSKKMKLKKIFIY
jgi:hypothetical protein